MDARCSGNVVGRPAWPGAEGGRDQWDGVRSAETYPSRFNEAWQSCFGSREGCFGAGVSDEASSVGMGTVRLPLVSSPRRLGLEGDVIVGREKGEASTGRRRFLLCKKEGPGQTCFLPALGPGTLNF